ncbi:MULTISPECIES: hypothetical protein [unclassified Bradyrhizobium]|uniref:hypothetical protein n=1 Tax=unclassified Bradyrhizobium TaxID=2631580 RepID=UPI0029165C19|nr:MULTISPECIES: hypothetical protein [unclassified Bradyrhizobium]
MWDFLGLALIALAVVVAITHTISEAARKLTRSKLTPPKEITLDAIMARVAGTGWHFAIEGDRYRIWHTADFAGMKREIVTSTAHNDVALWLRALGCLGHDETFAGCIPRYIPVDMHDDFGRPEDRLMYRAELLHRGGVHEYDIHFVVFDALVRGEVDHPVYYALLSLARAYVSGRAVSEADIAELIAALDPQELARQAAYKAAREAADGVA